MQPAAILSVLVVANTGPASRSLMRFNAGLKGTEASSSKATRAVGSFAKVATIGAAGVAGASVKMAADFEKSMRNVNSIAELPEKSFKRLNKQVLAMAGPTAQAPKTLADGLYDVVSSGFKAGDALKILRAGAKAATAGMTDTATATKAVTAVLNAYHRPAEDAKQVSDDLFQTVNLGVLTFEELSSTIGDVLPFAAQLGVNLKGVGAATTTMTKAGIGAPETMTRIKNVMVAMFKPSEGLADAYEKLGVAGGQDLIKKMGGGTIGFQRSLEAIVNTSLKAKDLQKAYQELGVKGFDELKKKTGSTSKANAELATTLSANGAEVAKLFPNIRALGGALALTGSNTKGAEKDLAGFADTAGSTNRVFAEQMKSFSNQMRQLKVNAEVLAITFGTKLLPPLNRFAKQISEVLSDKSLTGAEKFDKVGKIIADGIGKAGPVVAKAMAKVALIGVRGFFNAFRESPLWLKLVTAGFLLAKMGGFSAFRRIGVQSGTAMAGGIAEGAAKGSAGGGIAGRFKGAAGAFRTVGRNVLGFALIAGIMDAATKQGIKGFGDRFQQFASGATLGFLPAPKDIDERLATIAAKIRAWKGGNLKLSDASDPDNSLIKAKDLDDFTSRQRKMLTGLATLRNTATDFFGKDFKFTPKMEVNPEAATKKLRLLQNEFGRMKQGSVLSVKELRSVTAANFQRIADTMGTRSAQGQQAVAKNFRLAVNSVVDFKQRGILNASQAGKQIAALMKNNTGRGAAALSANMLKAERAIAATMSKSGKITQQGTDLIRALMVNAMKNMGLSPDTIRMSLNKRESAKKGPVTPGQTGLVVTGGKPAGDSVHALLERGEVVVNRKAVQKLGGPEKVNRLNQMIPRFQKGGIAGMPKGGFPDAMGALPGLDALAWVLKKKFGLGVMSGLRPGAITTSGNPSDHGWGGAIDVSNGITTPQMDAAHAWLAKISGSSAAPGVTSGGPIKQMLYRTLIGGDHFNHIHVALQQAYANSAAAVMKWVKSGGDLTGLGVAPKVDRLTVDAPDSMMKTMVQGALDKVRGGANKKLQSLAQSAAFSGTGGGGTDAVDLSGLGKGNAANRALGKRMASKFGWGRGKEWGALDDLWGHLEGHWDENLANLAGSGAYGIAQALPSSKYPPAGQPDAPPGLKKAQAQIGWGLNYIKGRYGDPLAAHAFRLANNYYAKGGVVGYVGDSLGVGTVPKLRGLIDRKIVADTASGRSSSSGVSALNGLLKKTGAGKQFVFDLGTNDGSAAQVSSSLSSFDRMTGKGNPLHALTLLGPDAGKKNAALRAKAGGDINLIDWAKVAGQYVGGDSQHIHPNDTGYQRRAQMVASAIKRARESEVLTKGQKRQIGRAGHGPLGQQFAQTIKTLRKVSTRTKFGRLLRNKRVDSLTKKLKGFGVLPGHLDEKIGILTKGVDEYGDYADRAGQLSVDNEDGTTTLGAFRGNDEQGWLKAQLSRMFALRNFLADAQKIIEQRRTQLAKFIKQVRAMVARVEEQIKEAAERRQALEKRLKQLKKNPKVNRKLIDQVSYDLKRTKQGQQDRVRTRKDLTKVLGGLNSRYGSDGLGGALTTNSEALDTIQGIGGPKGRLKTLPALGALGGTIFDVQLRLRDLAAPKTSITDPATGESDTGQADLLAQLLREANLRTAVSQRQYDVFKNFDATSGFMGAFAKGGVALVGERGPELAHLPSGTRVHSASDTQSMLAPNVAVHINGDIVGTPRGKDPVEVLINDRRFKAAVRNTRMRGGSLPGRGGGG